MVDQAAEGLLSPLLRRHRIEAARAFLHGRVLDIGCGSGALAEMVPEQLYLGVDVSEPSLRAARLRHARHRFQSTLPALEPAFDTVVALAVIEHVPDPTSFLRDLAARLAPSPESRIVCTTPHPSVDWVHKAGALLGLFSRHAAEEHEHLLGRRQLQAIAAECGLRVVMYRRFLLGANQILVFRRVGP
jgi:2-polyprenyl-3-methyl-5-hydroxy-6-metoxy-1,4-benzoquinol methylase